MTGETLNTILCCFVAVFYCCCVGQGRPCSGARVLSRVEWTQAQARMGRNSDWDWGGTEAVINRIAGEENFLEEIPEVNHISV